MIAPTPDCTRTVTLNSTAPMRLTASGAVEYFARTMSIPAEINAEAVIDATINRIETGLCLGADTVLTELAHIRQSRGPATRPAPLSIGSWTHPDGSSSR